MEHDCGIHCSGRPLTLAFPAPTLQLRQVTVLVPSTEMRLSDTLMELMWLLRKCTWMQAGTCQTPLLSCVHSRMPWLKVTERQGHEPGGRVVIWVLSLSSLLGGAASCWCDEAPCSTSRHFCSLFFPYGVGCAGRWGLMLEAAASQKGSVQLCCCICSVALS